MSYRSFAVAATPERDVGFSLGGEDFKCVADISIGVMEDYRAGFVAREGDENTVGIPLEVATKLVEDSLYPSEYENPTEHAEAVRRFRAARRNLPFDAGGDMVHAIREHLIEVYTGVDPTNEPTASLDGPSVSAPGSTESSGSQV